MKGVYVIMVKSTGVVRRVDELGRIVLPIEIRKNLDIGSGEAVEIFIENDKIILKKYEPSCLFCGNADNVVMYEGKLICRDCIAKIQAIK